MATSLLAGYMEGFTEVPGKLQQAFAALGSLDDEDTAVLATVNELVAQRLATAQGLRGQEPQEAGTPTGVKSGGGGKKAAVKGSGDAETAALLDRIAAAASTLAEHGAQRCGMAQENYDFVDALIVRLDKDLEACNAELVKHSDAQQAAAGGRRGKGASPALPGMPVGGASAVADAALAAGRSDLAVDPAEPVYCTCQRVSFGDMVACENDACPIEWYHYECVGLPPGQQPKGKWYCPTCKPPLKLSLKINPPAAAKKTGATGTSGAGGHSSGGAVKP